MIKSIKGRKLYRSKLDRKIGGVCGGIAEYLDVDSTVVRIIFVMVFLFLGVGLLFYVIAWLLIPEQPEGNIVKAIQKKK